VNNCFKKIITVFIAFTFVFGQLSVSAQTTAASACTPTGVLFGFFNGVQTTEKQAKYALEKLQGIHGETNQQGEKIKYEVFYNYSAGFEDFVETFGQRLKEQGGVLQGRFELFCYHFDLFKSSFGVRALLSV
jgi:hypothetical protein